MDELRDKRGLIVGISDERGLGWHCFAAIRAEGGNAFLTYHRPNRRERIERMNRAGIWEPSLGILELDVRSAADLTRLSGYIESGAAPIDFLIYAPVYGNLKVPLLQQRNEDYTDAHLVSVFGLVKVIEAVSCRLAKQCSIITFTAEGARRAITQYGVMGPCKAELEATVRQLAIELAPMRINAISASPIRTFSASMGIPNFKQLMEKAAAVAPLKRNATAEEVAATVVFLLSDRASAITGAVIPVDCGLHAAAG